MNQSCCEDDALISVGFSDSIKSFLAGLNSSRTVGVLIVLLLFSAEEEAASEPISPAVPHSRPDTAVPLGGGQSGAGRWVAHPGGNAGEPARFQDAPGGPQGEQDGSHGNDSETI